MYTYCCGYFIRTVSMINHIFNSLLENYDESDYSKSQQAKIILTVIFLAYLFLFLSILYYYFIQYKPIVIYAVSGSFILHIFYLYLFKKGHIGIVSQATILTNLAMVWTAIFFQGGPVLHRLDTIFIIFGILAFTPLIDSKRGYHILAYYLLNIIILGFLLYTFYLQKIMLPRSILSFSADALTGFLFSGSISFLIYTINLRMHERDRKKEKELINKTEELEATNEELTASMEELEATSEELFASMDQMEVSNHALEEEKERLLVTIRSLSEGVITTDIDNNVVLMNSIAEKLTGFDQREAAGKPLDYILKLKEFNSGDALERNDIPLKQKGGSLRGKKILTPQSGNMEYIIEYSSDPIRNNSGETAGAVIVFRDITDEEFIEKELKKIRQLESLGLVAGGIAHDFNNLLTSVLGNVNLAGLPSISTYEKEQCLEDAQKGLLQARELTRQLLTFSKGGMPIKKTTSIKNIIEDSVNFILRGSNIICRQSFEENLWNGIVDKSQISQVIQNLIINAKQAMPDGGPIDITVKNISIEKNNDLPITEGDYIIIRLKDSGTGIDKKILPDIFNPYFTTKESGHGLGLSVVYSIITKHNGYIFVDSEPGKGTLFTIYLPATAQSIIQEDIIKPSGFQGGKKILFMDDDEEIRKMAVKMIEILNCEAVTVPDSESAVLIFSQEFEKGEPFDLVILDVTIPGGPGGEETIKELLRIDPHITAIVSSGYSDIPVMSDYKKYGFSAFISKPYQFEELVNTISRLFEK